MHASIKYDFSVPLSFINEHVIVANHNVGQNLKKVIVFHRAGWLKIMWNSRKRFSTTSFIISLLTHDSAAILKTCFNRDVNFTKKLKKKRLPMYYYLGVKKKEESWQKHIFSVHCSCIAWELVNNAMLLPCILKILCKSQKNNNEKKMIIGRRKNEKFVKWR